MTHTRNAVKWFRKVFARYFSPPIREGLGVGGSRERESVGPTGLVSPLPSRVGRGKWDQAAFSVGSDVSASGAGISSGLRREMRIRGRLLPSLSVLAEGAAVAGEISSCF